MAERHASASTFDNGGIESLLASIDADMAIRVVEPLRVVALRFLDARSAAVATAVTGLGLHGLPDPGRFVGTDPFLLWRSPTECTLISTSDAVADSLLRALAPGLDPQACAIDQSSGVIAFELRGPTIDDILSRLIDASAIPREAGKGTRARLGDLAASILRISPERCWLLADRGAALYVADWLSYASSNASAAIRK